MLEFIATMITIVSSIFGIGGTYFAIYYQAKSRELQLEKNKLLDNMHMATIELKVENPPPYKSEKDYSVIRIRNVGTVISEKLWITALCSWSQEFKYQFQFPSDSWVLQPNESYEWKVRFCQTDNYSNENIVLEAKSIKSFQTSTSWQYTEKLR